MSRVKYVARIKNVHEVVVYGASDPQYWQSRLAELELAPLVVDGAAEIMIGAFRSRWMGIPFGETILCVRVVRQGPRAEEGEGAFLMQGYNTSGFFAWVERVRFKTPYLRGQVHLLEDEEFGFVVDGGPGHRFGARTELPPEDAEAIEENFEGAAYLPSGVDHHFGAFIQATRTTWPARPGDALRHDEATAAGVLAPLAEGGFEIRRWATSKTAVHARTATFRVSP